MTVPPPDATVGRVLADGETMRVAATGELLGASLGLHTLLPSQPVRDPAALDDLYGDLAAWLHEHGHVLLHEKAFGALDLAPAAARARDAAFRAAGLPPPPPHTYIEGRPCRGGDFAGIQAWSVKAAPGVEVLPADPADGVQGTLLRTPAGRALFLNAVTGRPAGGPAPADEAAELALLLDRADGALARAGFCFRDVARTWIFVDRLLDWYGDLNRVRTAFFRDRGLLGPGAGTALPASTGIEGRHPSGAEVVLDLLAIRPADGSGIAAEPLRSPRQDAAFHYGSAFSRGMRLGSDDAALVLVSGTASIDREGRTLYVGDAQGQVAETYLDVAAVLRAGGTRFADVAGAIRYHKDPAAWQAHCEMADLGLLPDLPAIDVFEDVCRPELLFEMEATALRRDPGPGRA